MPLVLPSTFTSRRARVVTALLALSTVAVVACSGAPDSSLDGDDEALTAAEHTGSVAQAATAPSFWRICGTPPGGSEICRGAVCAEGHQCSVRAGAVACGCRPGVAESTLQIDDSAPSACPSGAHVECTELPARCFCAGGPLPLLDATRGRARPVSIAASDVSSFAVTDDGVLYRWGGDDTDAGFRRAPTPIIVPLPEGRRARKVIASGRWACVLLDDGSVSCMGLLGMPDSQVRAPSPQPVSGVAGAVDLTLAPNHACAWTASGAVLCWGRPLPGWSAPWMTAQPLAGIGDAVAVVAGGDPDVNATTCMLRRTAAGPRAMCLGENVEYRGQLGHGVTDDANTATPVDVSLAPLGNFPGAPADTPFSMSGGGVGAFCIESRLGKTQCWGKNESGELGVPTPTGQLLRSPTEGYIHKSPQPVAPLGASRVFQTGLGCAFEPFGAASCWGTMMHGVPAPDLATASTETILAPRPLAFVRSVEALALGAGHACAIGDGGVLACWGKGDDGQLGTGQRPARGAPTPVRLPECSSSDRARCGAAGARCEPASRIGGGPFALCRWTAPRDATTCSARGGEWVIAGTGTALEIPTAVPEGETAACVRLYPIPQ